MPARRDSRHRHDLDNVADRRRLALRNGCGRRCYNRQPWLTQSLIDVEPVGGDGTLCVEQIHSASADLLVQIVLDLAFS
jgi:hypothetical protein